MSPTAKAELHDYNERVKRIRKESKKRDRQFAPRSVNTQFALGSFILGAIAAALVFAWWMAK